jgi:hypothetical protein
LPPWEISIFCIRRIESLARKINARSLKMRDKLIRRVIELSVEVDNDNLEFVNWDLLSNNEILDMFKRLIMVDTIMKAQNVEDN